MQPVNPDNQQASHLAVPSNLLATTPYKQHEQYEALMHKHGSSQHPHKGYFQSFTVIMVTYYLCISKYL